jgi:hypothetical protein
MISISRHLSACVFRYIEALKHVFASRMLMGDPKFNVEPCRRVLFLYLVFVRIKYMILKS